MHKCTCSLFTSAYFDMGLLMKVLEITWAKPMYMQYIFPCGGGMHVLLAMDTFMVRGTQRTVI